MNVSQNILPSRTVLNKTNVQRLVAWKYNIFRIRYARKSATLLLIQNPWLIHSQTSISVSTSAEMRHEFHISEQPALLLLHRDLFNVLNTFYSPQTRPVYVFLWRLLDKLDKRSDCTHWLTLRTDHREKAKRICSLKN